jgi:hypothetical protein
MRLTREQKKEKSVEDLINQMFIIAGHDVTASFMNFYLYKDAPVFNAYISLSPELALDMETRIPDRLATFKQNIFYRLDMLSNSSLGIFWCKIP